MDGVTALEGGSGVSVDGNSHTNVSSKDGGSRSNKVSSSSVWEVGGSESVFTLVAHLLPVDSETKDDSNGSGVDSEVEVFFGQEGDGTL